MSENEVNYLEEILGLINKHNIGLKVESETSCDDNIIQLQFQKSYSDRGLDFNMVCDKKLLYDLLILLDSIQDEYLIDDNHFSCILDQTNGYSMSSFGKYLAFSRNKKDKIMEFENDMYMHNGKKLNSYLLCSNNEDCFLLEYCEEYHKKFYEKYKSLIVWNLYELLDAPFYRSRLYRKFGDNDTDENTKVDFFKVLYYCTPITVLNIKSNEKLDDNNYIALARSYLLNIYINHGLFFNIRTKNQVAEMYLRGNNDRNFKLDPVSHSYNTSLMDYFDIAQQSQDYFAKYLSYYHIIEYFLEDVYYQYMIKSIRNKIQSPTFQINSDHDLKGFIIDMKKKFTKSADKGFSFNEKEAIVQSLKAFGNLESIENDLIKNYSKIDVEYFQNDSMFLNLEGIDLTNPDEVATRIYKIRNALVHSKNTAGVNYNHKEDAGMLAKEIPLIETIAINHIIANSTPID